MKQRYILLVVLIMLSFKGISQSNYSVTAIPFQQFTGNTVALTSNDDVYSPAIMLPFSFNFYGNTFNQITVSTNGFINFNTSSAGGFSPWSFSQTIPNSSFPALNSILGCFHDMNNASGVGTITYGTYGVSPYRKFVVYFNNQPHFQCTTLRSSFQMILHETSNIVDVQLIDKPVCTTWQAGRSVSGLINATGTQGIAAPGRNTGSWTAYHEGWRYSRPNYYPTYSYVVCDDDTDGFQSFNLNVAASDLSPTNPSAMSFYQTYTDAQNQVNQIANQSAYFNISSPQTIYALGNGVITPVVLSVIDCSVDYDNDTVSTDIEDVNNDTNLANDDTDGDGIPNYLDNDDDGDLVLTNLEYVFARPSTQNATTLLDTDNDGIPNYLDNDDDGDGVLTWREDYNGDGDPTNDDTNSNGIPDYLEYAVALGVKNDIINDQITIYPNPTNDVLNIANNSSEIINSISIFSISGSVVKQLNTSDTLTSISVSALQSGVYFIKIELSNKVVIKKFVKQ